MQLSVDAHVQNSAPKTILPVFDVKKKKKKRFFRAYVKNTSREDRGSHDALLLL